MANVFPHPKLSIARALKVGMESGAETARVELRETLTPQEFLKGLNEQLPEGIRVTSASIR